jgi:hypothetical protein
MSNPAQLVLGLAILVGLGALALLARRMIRAYLAWRGTRIVVCPENHEMVAVAVDAKRAALGSTQSPLPLRLETCTRWPEKAGCGQECLGQIEHAPEACLLTHILGDWYQGKSCAFCGKGFASIHWHDHKPALLAPGGAVVEWSDFAPEQIVDVLASHEPVCWDCAVAERFRREHPELVTDRSRPSSPPPSMA